jgi:predicted Rossmann fold nucleotide-binding protein DprA/Smf involved in DNA uptake
MSEVKFTKRDNFATLRGMVAAAKCDTAAECIVQNRLLAFIDHEVELLDRKRTPKGKSAKVVAEQAEAMNDIAEVLFESAEPMRATAIATATGYSVQKVSAMLRKMVLAGTVAREQDGKVVTFTLT